MFVLLLLHKFPYITISATLRSKLKILLGYKVDNFVSWQEIAWIEIYAALTFPYNDLTNRKVLYYLMSVLNQTALNPPLVIVKYRAIIFDEPIHFC